MTAGSRFDSPVVRIDGTFGLTFRSTFGRGIPGAKARTGRKTEGNRIRIFFINSTIPGLYNFAVTNGLRNRYILEVKDSAGFIRSDSISPDVWQAHNNYCYELIAPEGLSDEDLKRHMLNDLNNDLGLNARLEMRMMTYWALCETNTENPTFKTSGGKPIKRFYRDSSLEVFKNQPLSAVIKTLNIQNPIAPRRPIIIDETHYKGNVDISIKTPDIHTITIPALRQQLQQYGLSLVQKKKSMKVFVISEKNSHPSLHD